MVQGCWLSKLKQRDARFPHAPCRRFHAYVFVVEKVGFFIPLLCVELGSLGFAVSNFRVISGNLIFIAVIVVDTIHHGLQSKSSGPAQLFRTETYAVIRSMF